MTSIKKDKLIIANSSGFFGDRFTAPTEMVRGGPIDVLTGDYLAELTMAILFRKRRKDPNGGYVSTFLKQMEPILGECLDKQIRIVSNAGGLNPRALAEALQALAAELGLYPKIAYIEGDDLMGRLGELRQKGERFEHMDKGIGLFEANAQPISANAYLGGWGIAEALGRGADIVVGGRIADAALVVGPAAWHFGWQRDEWDKLAGAVAAGHIIECSAQATGGNYSFIEEVPSFKNVGFPLAEMHEDGSFVITKHPNTGGLVSVGTVTAQLLYETRQPCYLTPDVGAHFDTLQISQQAPDRVLVKGARGEPAPKTTKVTINTLGGYRNTMSVVLTGLDIEKKAQIVEEVLFDSLGGKEQFAVTNVQLIRSDQPNPTKNEEACAYLRMSVMDPDAKKVGRFFSSKVVELALANIPGFSLTAPPSKERPAIVNWSAFVSTKHIQQTVLILSSHGDEQITVESIQPDADAPRPELPNINFPPIPAGKKVPIALGRLFGTRSGDKGGNANLGVWAKNAQAYAFLREFLTTDKLKALLPDMSEYEIERYELPNLFALNFYIKGVLGEGVAASLRSDPQAKTLGEYLRAKVIDVPEPILDS